MSNLLLGLLLFFLSCSSFHGYNDILIEFKEDGSITETPIYREPHERQQGSGLGITPHMRLGPGGNGSIHVPTIPDVHAPPPANNGQAGNPIDLPPDDPGTPNPGPSAWNCNITFINQTSTEKAKYNTVCTMLERIVPSAAFKNSIETARSYNGAIGYYGTSSTCNSAGELGNVGPAVYTHIRNGDERKPSTTAVDYELDITVEMYTDMASSTIGYTYATSAQIWVNRKYSDGYKPSSLGSNLFHEWLHKMSYGHSSASTACRPYSIPYAMGYIARDYMSAMQSEYGY